jgi:hypothetical protein
MFENLMPHKECFLWASHLIPLYFIANILIGISYVGITGILLYIYFKRKDFALRKGLYVYGGFILLCGVGHFLMIINLFKGNYHLETFWHMITAIISLGALHFTYSIRVVLIKTPTIHYFLNEIQKSKKTILNIKPTDKDKLDSLLKRLKEIERDLENVYRR